MQTNRCIRGIYASLSVFALSVIIAVSFAAPRANAVVPAVLGVTQITATQTYATADGLFADGWKWVFDVTVPNDQTLLKMKFADWVSGLNIIPAGGNIRFYSDQSTNASDGAHAILITASSTWSDIMDINPSVDLDALQGGRQIEITVEARIPTGSAGGSYSTSYGINTTAPAGIEFGDLNQTYNGTPKPVTVTTTPTGLTTLVTYNGSTTPPTHVGNYSVFATVTDPNYAGTSSAALVINTAPVSIVADTKTKVYDNSSTTDPALTYTITPPLFDGDSVTGALTRDPGEDVGSYNITQGTLALDGDYLLTYSPNFFTITPAVATIDVNGLNQTYDKTGKHVTVTTVPVGLHTDVTYDGSATLPVNAGTYHVIVTLNDPNPDYIGSTSTNLIIAAAPITVTAVTDSKVYDGTKASIGIPTITSGALFDGDTAVWIQSFDNKDVGPRTLTATGTPIDSNGGHNYAITFVNANGSISAAPATITAIAHDKVYDGTTAATVDLTVNGAVGGDVLSAHDSASFDTKAVGTNKTVTITGIVLSGTNSGDYHLESTTATAEASITPATLAITANNQSKTYGDTFAFTGNEFSTSPSPLFDGDSVTSVSLTSAGAAASAPISGSPYQIVPSDPQGSGLGNYNISAVNGSLTVNKRSLTFTISASNKVFDNTLTATITGCAVNGIANGDPVTCTATNGRFADVHAGDGKLVTADINVSGDGGNYSWAPTATTYANITKAPVVILIHSMNKTYDGTTAGPILNSSINPSAGGSIPGGPLCLRSYTAAFIDKNVGVGKAVNITNIVLGAYDLIHGSCNDLVSNEYAYDSFASTSADITALHITVTAQPNTKTYNGNTSAAALPLIIPALAIGDTSGFFETYDNANVGTGKTLTIGGNVNDGNGGNNYATTTVSNQNGVINIANQTITFVTYPSGPVMGNSFTVTATSTSGLPVTFSGGAAGICTVGSTGTVNLQGSGQCPVIASQGGDANHGAAQSVTKTFTIVFTSSASLLTSTDITNNGTTIGTLAGASLVTTSAGSCDGTNGDSSACHVLNVANVQVAPNGSNLPVENDGFTLQASGAQQSALMAYFAGKGWPTNYINQINSEISGAAPFFYFVSNGNGGYSLADGFQWGLGTTGQQLLIDDNYPVGTYTFNGYVNGNPVTVNLTVSHVAGD